MNGKNNDLKKAPLDKEQLEQVMDWNPRRTEKMKKTTPEVMKEIWESR